jgi:hypothetical protein
MVESVFYSFRICHGNDNVDLSVNIVEIPYVDVSVRNKSVQNKDES